LGIAVLTKWLPLLLAPAFLVYAWRRGWLRASTIAAAVVTVVAITALTLVPVWAGADTFNGIRRLGTPRFVASTVGTLGYAMGADYYGLVRALASSVALAVALYGAWLSRTHATLLRGCGMTVLAYLLIASPLFWAWYLLLPIAILVLTRDLTLVLVLTAASRAVAPLDLLRLRGGITWTEEAWITTVVALWIPLVFIAVRGRGARGLSRMRVRPETASAVRLSGST
jgi:hypothetical protein